MTEYLSGALDSNRGKNEKRKTMVYLKVVMNQISGRESRDLREIATAAKVGFETHVLSLGDTDGEIFSADGITFHSCRPFPKIYGIKYVYFFFLYYGLIKRIRLFKADIISCHDIIALVPGYLSTLFMPKQKRPKLIYDAHEFEMGRNIARSPFWVWYYKHLEGFLMRRCALNIMVNDSIADETQRIHALQDKPLVIRSTPPKWNLDPEIIEQKKKWIKAQKQWPDETFLAMYHGGMQSNRGIEHFIRVIAKCDGVCGVIMGYGEENYVDSLKKLADEQGVAERLLFIPAVARNDIWKYAGAVDVEVSTMLSTCKSYYFALPNKFFESIQSMTPIIASDFPEMKRITEEYDIGLTCNPSDVEKLTSCVIKMKTDNLMYDRFKKNLIKAKNDLCWEKESIKLEDALLKLKNEELQENQKDG